MSNNQITRFFDSLKWVLTVTSSKSLSFLGSAGRE